MQIMHKRQDFHAIVVDVIHDFHESCMDNAKSQTYIYAAPIRKKSQLTRTNHNLEEQNIVSARVVPNLRILFPNLRRVVPNLRIIVIIRDIVSDFNDDEDIELCCDDDDFEIATSEPVYGHEFQPIDNEEYWPPYSGPTFIPNPLMRRNQTTRPKTTRIYNEMDDYPLEAIKKCGLCRTEGHNRKTCQFKNREVGESSSVIYNVL
ncbi:hypothetical protein Lal_00019547 [Lupinus albus]|nr:hypothetical protein Lal_00019547 [Lupinus albus]